MYKIWKGNTETFLRTTLNQFSRFFYMFQRFLPLLIFCFSCVSQKKINSAFVPPGTVQVNDTLFVDATETANIHWREYLFYLQDVNKDTAGFYKALPDTLVWNNLEWKPDTVFKKIVLLNNPYQEIYFRHPAFNNYPVVGISYEQVVDFCKWRTFAANQVIYFNENNIANPRLHLKDKFPIRFIYRLPTKEEWESIASSPIDSTSKVFRKYSKKSSFYYNAKEYAESKPKKNDIFNPYTADTKSFYISRLGTYHMIGNIAEMISEKGIAKGGSFNHPLDSCKIIIDQHYVQLENWLGFRSVAVLVK